MSLSKSQVKAIAVKRRKTLAEQYVSKKEMKKALRAAIDAQKNSYDCDVIDDKAKSAVEAAILAIATALSIDMETLHDGGWKD